MIPWATSCSPKTAVSYNTRENRPRENPRAPGAGIARAALDSAGAGEHHGRAEGALPRGGRWAGLEVFLVVFSFFSSFFLRLFFGGGGGFFSSFFFGGGPWWLQVTPTHFLSS